MIKSLFFWFTEEKFILIFDELGSGNQDWRSLRVTEGVDLVILPKEDPDDKKQLTFPDAEFGVKVHHLPMSYRQSKETHMSHLYLSSHYYDAKIPDIANHQYERCPQGKQTLWIDCEEGVSQIKVLEKLKEELKGETNVMIHAYFKEEAELCKEFCEKQQWTVFYEYTSYYGYESEVSTNQWK